MIENKFRLLSDEQLSACYEEWKLWNDPTQANALNAPNLNIMIERYKCDSYINIMVTVSQDLLTEIARRWDIIKSIDPSEDISEMCENRRQKKIEKIITAYRNANEEDQDLIFNIIKLIFA